MENKIYSLMETGESIFHRPFFVKVSIYTVKLRFTSNPGVTIITVNIYILYTFQTLKL